MRLSAAVAAVAALLVSAAPVAAEAAAPPEGLPCGFSVMQAAPLGDGVYNGELHGGPVVATGGEPVSLTCEIRVNGAAVMTLTGPRLPGVGLLSPASVSFSAGDADVIELCSAATVGSATWYFDGEAWSADDATACPDQRLPVGEVFGTVLGALPEPVRPVAGYVLCLAYPTWGPRERTTCDGSTVFDETMRGVDEVVCPVLAASSGTYGVVELRTDGDVYVLGEPYWDCPPYGIWPS